MHIGVIFVLNMAGYNSERVFKVDLIFQDTEGNLELKTGARAYGDRITKKTDSRLAQNHDTALPDQQRELLSEGMGMKTAAAYKSDALPVSDKQSPLNEHDKHMSVSHDIGKGYNGEALISNGSDNKGGFGFKERGSNSGNDIVESEFGSINGPSFLKTIKPEYPRLARRLGKEGKVVLRLFIDEHGRLVSVELIENAGYGFDEAAIEAVKASSFQPAKLNGHPVACKALLPIRFKFE